jgi:hypothetical protein
MTDAAPDPEPTTSTGRTMSASAVPPQRGLKPPRKARRAAGSRSAAEGLRTKFGVLAGPDKDLELLLAGHPLTIAAHDLAARWAHGTLLLDLRGGGGIAWRHGRIRRSTDELAGPFVVEDVRPVYHSDRPSFNASNYTIITFTAAGVQRIFAVPNEDLALFERALAELSAQG